MESGQFQNRCGVQLSITFATSSFPLAPNAASLVKAGYNLPQSKEPIDVSMTKRGIYRLTEKRNDMKAIGSDVDLQLVPIDPGCIKPLQGAVVPLTNCSDLRNICEYIRKDEPLWHYTAEQWKRGSGRSKIEEREASFRQKNTLYDKAVDALRKKRKKTACPETLEEFCTSAFKHHSVLVSR